MSMDEKSMWAVGALAAVLGAGALWDGLYAPAQQLILVATLAGLALYMRGRATLSRLEGAALLLLAAGVAGSFVAPAAAGTAAHGPLLLAGWALALLLGRQLAGARLLEPLLARTWLVSAPVVVFGGLVAMSYLPVHHSARLASFLGYPIAVGVLGMLGLAGALADLKEGRWWAAPMACASAAGLFLSGSRGVWAAALLLALYLLWAAPGLLRRAFWPVAAALAAALWAGPAVAAHRPLPALAAVAVATMTALGINRFHCWRWLGYGAVLPWLGALAAAPGWGWFLGRATAITLAEGSATERLTFLRDGWALVQELPLGAGHRAWSVLHLQGASYGYYSAEVHSALLEVAISFGWLGAAGFILLLGSFLLRLLHGRSWPPHRVAVLGALGVVALHSQLDWELSYGIFMLPLWLGFGLAAEEPNLSLRVGAPVTMGLASLTLAGTLLLGTGEVATHLAERALSAGDPARAYMHAGLAVSASPWNDLSHAVHGQVLANLEEHEAALAAYERARRLGPYEPWYAELLARELLGAGRWLEAAEAYRELARLWPWYLPAYEVALQAHMEISYRTAMSGEEQVRAAIEQSARGLLEALEVQKAKEPERIPRPPMDLESPMMQRARSYYLR